MNQYQLLAALRTMDEIIERKRPAGDRTTHASRAFRAPMTTPRAPRRDVMLSLVLIVVLFAVLAAVAAPGASPGI